MSWPTVPLPEVFWFQEGPGLRNWQFTTEGIKILNVGNIMPDGSIDLSRTDRHLSKEEFEAKYSHFSVDEGDLVIASSGISFDPDGYLRTKIGFIEEEHLPLCMNTSTIRFKATEGVSCLRYLKHWFQSHEFRQQVSQRVTGSAQLNFGPSHLKTMKITLPPLEEQRRVAGILDQADALRRLRTRALDKLGTLGQAIFQEMFGDVRRNQKGFERIQLGELIKVSSGQGLTAKDMKPGEFPVYGGNGINGYHDEGPIPANTIVIGRVGAYCGAVHTTSSQCWVTDNALIVRNTAPANTAYLAAALELAELNQYAGRAAQPLVSGSRIYPVEILFPPLEMQDEFERTLVKSLNQKALMDRSVASFDELFAALQHRAFQGEL